jgi:hypothetical protein
MAVVRGVAHQPTPRELFHMSFAPLALFLLLAVAFRRQLMSSSINRQTLVGLLTITCSITIARGLGVKLGLGTPTMIVHDCLLAAAILAFATTTAPRWLGFHAAALLVAAFFAAYFPAYAHFTFNLAVSLALFTSAALGWRYGTRK